MGKLREDWNAGDSSRIWEHLAGICRTVNPYLEGPGTYVLTPVDGMTNGGADTWSGSMYVRRMGDDVAINGHLSPTAASVFVTKQYALNDTSLFSLPIGMRPTWRNYNGLVGRFQTSFGISGDLYYSTVASRVRVMAPGSSAKWVKGSWIQFECRFLTIDAQPTSLPGRRI